MSDVTVAPNAAPAQPSVNEVVVNQNPVNQPTPIGSQAPDKPVDTANFKGSEHRPPSRREAIQKAFAAAQAEAKPAEAKMGHNRPPEPMQREKPKETPKVDPDKSTFNLRKRPDDQSKADAQPDPKKGPDPQPRADHGHFAQRQQQAEPNQQQQPQQQPQPGHDPYREPLQRMSPQAKAEWAKTPPSVRADVHRLHQEFGNAYQQYRGDHEVMNTVRHYDQMARQQGSNLRTVIDNYHGMEKKLRADPIGALDLIVDNLNLQPHDQHGRPSGPKLSLTDIAWAIINQTPEQRQLLQSRNTAMAQSHQLQAAQERIQNLEKQHEQVQYAAAWTQARAGIDQFATTHPHVDNPQVAALIKQEIGLGFDLETAYQRAVALAGTAAQTRTNGTAAQTRTTTAQTRPPDRSISGAPGGTSNGTGQHRKPVGRREAIANAIKRVNANGSL